MQTSYNDEQLHTNIKTTYIAEQQRVKTEMKQMANRQEIKQTQRTLNRNNMNSNPNKHGTTKKISTNETETRNKDVE